MNSKYNTIVGPLLFISGLQYFVIQLIVGLKFSPQYSIFHNTISDLGYTTCNLSNKGICSPLHTLMNGSFVVLGIAMIFGSILISRYVLNDGKARLGLNMFMIGGLGTVLVGLFPENTSLPLHKIGASLPFLIGNVGLVLVSLSLKLSKNFRLYTFVSGVIALMALGLYIGGYYLGLGKGGMERVVAYPQTIWMIIFGSYLLLNAEHSKSKK